MGMTVSDMQGSIDIYKNSLRSVLGLDCFDARLETIILRIARPSI